MIHLIGTLSLMDLIKILLKNSNAGYTIQRDVKTNLILDVIQKSLIWNQENKAIKLRKSKKNLLKTFFFSHFTSLTFPRRAISKRFRLANRFCNSQHFLHAFEIQNFHFSGFSVVLSSQSNHFSNYFINLQDIKKNIENKKR